MIPLFLSCGNNDRDRTSPYAQSIPAATTESKPIQKVKIEYAEGFQVHYFEGYARLDILNPYQDQTDTLEYILVPRGKAIPRQAKGDQVIEVPVRSMIVTSTTHLALTDMLNANSIITGVTQPDYVFNPEIREGLESGQIEGFTGGKLNKELSLAMDPDLVMVSGGQAALFDNYRVLLDSGINVLVNSEWLEQMPLGKAEWIKMMGVLLNKEQLANRKFREIEQQYLALKRRVDSVRQKPLVINNMPYKGAWFVSGGDSFTAQFFRDAGADYSWYDNSSTGGLRLDFETVYEVGLRAPVWLNPGSAKSKEDILAADSRFRDFESYQKDQIYNNNRRMSPSGGNDFWESGVVHPEIILADLIKILHPGLLPRHELYYYQKLD